MLEIQNLSVNFTSYSKGLKRTTQCAIRSLDLSADAGQIIAVVGQSGAGKSLLAHAVLDILPENSSVSGDIIFRNTFLTSQAARQLRGRQIALIPQSISFLNPLLNVGSQIARSGILKGLSPSDSRKAALESLKRYNLPGRVYKWFPFQLSGGMAKRVLTATATIGSADLLLADEPTNGLDKDTALETLSHLRQLADTGKAVILITHDIDLALQVADRVSVFCAGVTIEEADATDFTDTNRLRHPYTKALWLSLPRKKFTKAISNSAVTSSNHSGCPFCLQCDQGRDECFHTLPRLVPYKNGKVRCCLA